MKKFAVVLAAALMMLMFASVASAHAKPITPRRHLRGEIVSIDASASAVTFLRLNGQSATLTVSTETVIRRNGRRVAFDRLALGDRGHAKFVRDSAGDLQALKIFVHTPFMTGRIIEITTDTVTLKRAKVTRTFIVDADTSIRRKGADVELADLKIGDAAKVFYNKTEVGDLLAGRIRSGGRKH